MNKSTEQKTILLGICGSIAAYKSIDLAKLLIEANYRVEIVLSQTAPDFISVMTLKSLFPGQVFLSTETLGSADDMLHISLAKRADYILIAPASAQMIAQLRSGQASCLLSTLCLASAAPVFIAPAMNQQMWAHPAVVDNVRCLKERGVLFIGPVEGLQACGDYGYGRFIDSLSILSTLENYERLSSPLHTQALDGKKVLITAGPTREYIDPIRYISNESSGKMGAALAKAAAALGAEVCVIIGHSCPSYRQEGITYIPVVTAEQMFTAVKKHIVNIDIFIGTAAVADYKPQTVAPHKIKKQPNQETLSLVLTKNPDIIAWVKKEHPDIFCVGFAAETQESQRYGLQKLQNKQLDLIAINDVSGGDVFGGDENALEIISKTGQSFSLDRSSKDQIATELWAIILRLCYPDSALEQERMG